MGRGVDKLRVFDDGCGLGEPRWVPERTYFSARLIPRASAAVEAFEAGRIQKEDAHAHTPTRLTCPS